MFGRLFLRIVDEDGQTVTFPAGGPAEADLIAICRDAILKRGVGLGRTSAHVAQDITAGMHDALEIFKARTAGREPR